MIIVEHALKEKWVRDPFDRLIVAHAKANDAPLVTKDERIRLNYRHALW
jgi:PIN domain nuclease of toxin-antitoxin system